MEPKPPSAEEAQKLIGRVTRLAGIVFLGLGAYILAIGSDVIVGSAVLLVGLTDIVLLPRILEKVMIQKLKEDKQRKQQD